MTKIMLENLESNWVTELTALAHMPDATHVEIVDDALWLCDASNNRRPVGMYTIAPLRETIEKTENQSGRWPR